MLRKLAISLAILVAVPVVFVPGWIVTHTDDLPEVDDADLAVVRSEVAPGSNGFEFFEQAARTLDWPEDADGRLEAIRDGAPIDAQWVEQMLERNAVALAWLRRGTRAPAFVLPVSRLDDTSDGCCAALLAVTRLLRLSGAAARLHTAAGEHGAATDLALLGLRAGRRISSAEGINLVAMMSSASSMTIGLADLTAAVRAAPLPRDRSAELVAELESTRWTHADWKRVWAAEYEATTASFAQIDAATPDEVHASTDSAILRVVPATYLWQPRRTRASFAEFYRGLQRRSGQSCREVFTEIGREGDRRVGPVDLVSPNSMGAILLAIAQPNFERFDTKRCHAETRISLAEVVVAAKAFEGENGRLPDRLEDLVPRYLARVPEDRFAGEPLRYSRERKVVWSIGEDLTDASGGEKYDSGDVAEPAMSLTF